METEKQIRVVAIPDNTRIIINIGYATDLSEYGYDFEKIDVDDSLVVYEKGVNIIDPNTKESLGSYDPIKAILTATEVEENFSVLRLEKDSSFSFSSFASPMKNTNTKSYQEIPVKEDEVLDISLKEPRIVIGDLVKFVLEN